VKKQRMNRQERQGREEKQVFVGPEGQKRNGFRANLDVFLPKSTLSGFG
jgi:hypothetical protein